MLELIPPFLGLEIETLGPGKDHFFVTFRTFDWGQKGHSLVRWTMGHKWLGSSCQEGGLILFGLFQHGEGSHKTKLELDEVVGRVEFPEATAWPGSTDPDLGRSPIKRGGVWGVHDRGDSWTLPVSQYVCRTKPWLRIALGKPLDK